MKTNKTPGQEDVPEALLADGEGRRLQREDLRLHEELAHAPVDHLAVLSARVQDHHGALVVVLPILELCRGVLGLEMAPVSEIIWSDQHPCQRCHGVSNTRIRDAMESEIPWSHQHPRQRSHGVTDTRVRDPMESEIPWSH